MSTMQAVACGDSKVVSLRRDGHGKWFLVNKIARSRVALDSDPPREWYLGFDDDDAGFVCSSLDEGPTPCDELFGFSLFLSECGAYRLGIDGGSGGLTSVTLASALAGHSLFSATIKMGSLGAGATIDCAWFSRPFDGGHVMWSLAGEHSSLGLADGRNSTQLPGRFVAEGWRAWEKRVAGLGMPGGLLRSSVKSTASVDGAEDRRVLMFPSASTGASLGSLATWAFSPANEGGFKLDAQRKSLAALLEVPHGCAGAGRGSSRWL